MELCQPRVINSMIVSCRGGALKEIQLTYSMDGINFNCYRKC